MGEGAGAVADRGEANGAVDRIAAGDIDALATGASLLGCGGGGSTLVGRMLCRAALRSGPVDVTSSAALPPDAVVVHVGAVGAPDIFAERMVAPADMARAAGSLAHFAGIRPAAVGIIEIGGLNAMMPIVAAAELGLPVVDGDLMGRAFPSVHSTTLAVRGAPIAPFALVGAAGEVVLVEESSRSAAESMLLSAVSGMGGSAALAIFPTSAADLGAADCGGSLSTCMRLGRDYLRHRDDPVPELARRLGGTVAFEGWVAEMRPREVDSPGAATLVSMDGSATCRVDFRDELLQISYDGIPVAGTPEIIIALQSTTGAVLQVDDFAAGQAVSIVTLSALHRWPVGAAAVIGPPAFGLDTEISV